MGTRSLTLVYNDSNRALINMYRQYDGYPSGHGRELSSFLSSKKIVNGLADDNANVANGMSCLAAQLVRNFKTEAGGIYLEAVSDTDLGQDYEYHVFKDRVLVKSGARVEFTGSYVEFDTFCRKED